MTPQTRLLKPTPHHVKAVAVSVIHVSPVDDQTAHDTATAEPDCVCGPTVQPVPGADGSMGWLIVHHSLDGRELAERGC